jgi:predicted phosphoribosyltransferase
MALFANRREAGRILGSRLAGAISGDAIVLALPRGGVPVGYEVANAIGVPLDVLVVRKLGVPGQEELAMGAIASGGVRVLVPDVIESFGITPPVVEAVAARERRELERRERAYRDTRPLPDVRGRPVVVVDDGVATGASMIAAVRAVRALGAGRVVAAAPVMSAQARAAILRVADACEAVAYPEPFLGVGVHYADFAQTTDDEVRERLAAARHDASEADVRPAQPAGGDGWRR